MYSRQQQSASKKTPLRVTIILSLLIAIVSAAGVAAGATTILRSPKNIVIGRYGTGRYQLDAGNSSTDSLYLGVDAHANGSFVQAGGVMTAGNVLMSPDSGARSSCDLDGGNFNVGFDIVEPGGGGSSKLVIDGGTLAFPNRLPTIAIDRFVVCASITEAICPAASRRAGQGDLHTAVAILPFAPVVDAGVSRRIRHTRYTMTDDGDRSETTRHARVPMPAP